jgi:uroporphyrin-III C-methyltransferase
MSKLSYISEKYQAANRAEIPVCIIQNASTTKEKMAVGKVSDLERMAEENKLSNPAIIIIGEVVDYHTLSLSNIERQYLEI